MVDWLKCVGMLVIVYGHVAGWAPLAALAPIYSKQLVVAVFPMPRVHLARNRECRFQFLRRYGAVQTGSGEKFTNDPPLGPAIEIDLVD